MSARPDLPEVERLSWPEIAEGWERVAEDRGEVIDRLFGLIHNYERTTAKLIVSNIVALAALLIVFWVVAR